VEYRVEELATAAGIGVDTLRFYQARGLLPAPLRRGRVAIYSEIHLDRLQQVRELQRQGFSLAQIQRLSDSDAARDPGDALLSALRAERAGARTLSRGELAAESGVPEALIRSAEAAGLLQPLRSSGEERFSESDLELARAGLRILGAGLPLDELLGQALRHARNVREVCDAAIELFDRHVRKAGPVASDPEAISQVFRELLPQVTRIVALHFQRTLVQRALERAESAQDGDPLVSALAAAEPERLQVEVSWR
jgi:DNA-binding transcriptional MerR regulator